MEARTQTPAAEGRSEPPAVEVAPVSIWPLEGALLEGPVWVAREAALWFVDIKQKRLHRFDPVTGERRSYDAPTFPGFLLPKAGGGFVVGLQNGLHHWAEGGAFEQLVLVEEDLPDNRLNDAVVDPSGHLWFGTMDNRETMPTGKLYRLPANGRPVAMGPGCCITNGPAFSPDGRTCYFVDTLARTVTAYPVNGAGMLGQGRPFCTIEPGAGNPDGVSVDAEGDVWLGLYGGWAARRYTPDGTLAATVRFPVANITKIAFGGADGRTAFATTARQGLSVEDLVGQPLAGALFSFRVDVPGAASAEIAHGV